ncbi:SU10 major capsid protein [Clostridium tyrobutyricum]|uniref:SU10 major capsid protein n=2 Tax=Clostridium tyrobutyricum TaxID=1519 RepID=UPI001C38E6E9|nr:DUF5309 family protein [Clostridium tyrobutyricum]MBV4415884.1 DUF5309 domain-containing protein [Clostridium tyrobutyricum]MBV4421850.1 DUF5309 domain-containing protein [Clostridium tyrobutyricum]
MIQTKDFLSMENIDLMAEMGVAQPLDTPLTTLLMGRGQTDKETAPLVYFREKTLDTTEDISQVEGSETTEFQASTRLPKNNYCEIFKKAVSVSGTAQASSVTGIADMYTSEMADRLVELKVNLEKALTNGVKNDGSATPFVRRMDGIFNFVDAGNKITNASLTEDEFKATVKRLWDNGLGSNGYVCLANADLKEKIDTFYQTQYNYNAPTGEFGLVANKINTNYGNVSLMLDRHIPEGNLIIFDPNYVRLGFLRTPFSEVLAKTGDNVKGQVLAEATIKVLNSKALATFTIA